MPELSNPNSETMTKKTNCRLVVGLFWGDEGKAKAVDVLGENADIVARYQGGANAGHTVYTGGEKFVFHQVPSGVLREDVTGVLGAGMVIDLPELVDEIRELKNRGIDATSRLVISSRAHLVTSLHKRIEKIQETKLGIGTTLRGIGPTYSDKYARRGLRIGQLVHKHGLEESVRKLIDSHRPFFEFAGEPVPTADEILTPLLEKSAFIEDMVDDVSLFLTDSIHAGKSVLIEGAQGSMLDIDWGTYPFVTSSSTALSGVASGLGIDPRLVEEVIGLVKAFTTRVGNGPLPTELIGEEGERLRGTGEHEWDEFGATTGRPRRCGWLDGFVLTCNCRRWGVDKLFLTKLDVLDGMEKARLCSAYKKDGKVLRAYPSTAKELELVEPVFEELEGWSEGVARKTKFESLPENAKYYVKRVEQIAGCPVGWISTGPNRENTIVR